jgi:methylase of polypeptide subunit release factors
MAGDGAGRSEITRSEGALLRLGRLLRASEYRFVTPTPETHRRVNGRPDAALAADLPGVFGWSRSFRRDLLSTELLGALREADALEETAGICRSGVRFSSLGRNLFVHSRYPTVEEDAVFFGPDTYRFARLVGDELAQRAERRVALAVDIGCGSGAGGIVAAQALAARPGRLVLADISRRALSFARVNAALNDIPAETLASDILQSVDGQPDLIIANPPYLVDAGKRLYRDGGGTLGFDLSLRILREAVERLRPGGLIILYTGSAIVAGRDLFREAAAKFLATRDIRWRYDEIDPDVFGEELENPAYLTADRIAVVGLVVTK